MRTEFFKKLHEQLAQKYKTSSFFIMKMRVNAINKNRDRLEMMDTYDELLLQKEKEKNRPRRHWLPLFTFLENLSDDDWNEITKRTKFDK